MTDKILADIPARIWEEGRHPDQHVWDAEFNVAGWVKVSGTMGEACMLVRYEDEAGEHSRVVDSCRISAESNNLMSGPIGVRVTGKTKKAQVILRLSEPGMRFHVEELFVQRKGSAAKRENKLISNC